MKYVFYTRKLQQLHWELAQCETVRRGSDRRETERWVEHTGAIRRFRRLTCGKEMKRENQLAPAHLPQPVTSRLAVR